MENKQFLKVTLLCMVIVMGWMLLGEYMGWVKPQQPLVQTQAVEETATPTNTAPVNTAPLFAPSAGKEVRVETPHYTAVFHSAGAVLQSFTLKDFDATSAPESPKLNLVSESARLVSPMGLLVNGQPSWNQATWSVSATDVKIEKGQSQSIIFEGKFENLTLQRTLTFFADTYLISENINVQAQTANSVRMGYTLAATPFSKDESGYDPMLVSWDMGGSLDEEASVDTLVEEGLVESGALYWGGLMTNYFMTAAIPSSQDASLKARIQNNVWRVAIEETPRNLAAAQATSYDVNWWFGPKEQELLNQAPNELGKAIDMGWFSVIAKPLLMLLSFIQGFVGNWGVAIIILTILIKIVFWPLTKKSYKSMEQMKRIAPLMEEVKKKHADNKEAMSREMMQLYKTYNVNPMSGCLPILVQLPVFVALYNALLNSIDLRHADFITYLPFTDMLWLADLSVKDPFYITPILMGATMFIQQWLSPSVGDPTQRKVMMMMPFIFTFMFLSFPSGLVLYWLVNNILSIAQQWWTLRKV